MRAVKLFAVHGKRPVTTVLIFLVLCSALFAKGKKEEEKREEVNKDFILCITSFNVEGLPPGMQILGSVLQKELVVDLARIHYRVRSDDEISRYQELAIRAAMSDAAAKLSSKRAERDALLFSGAPDWKYKKEIKKITKEILELEDAYKKAADAIPLIAGKPLFLISEYNQQNGFPIPPQRGEEEEFLKTYKYDAFLEGKFQLAYGRVYAEFRFFTRGGSFVYEDYTIFSQEDLNEAADELKSRFLAALVNAEPAGLKVTTEPADARLEVNGRLANTGETVELPPGPVIIFASADDYQAVEKEIELEGGDTQEITFVLMPLAMETIGINIPGSGSLVYMGAMFLGGDIAAVEYKETETAEVETAEVENAEVEKTEVEMTENDTAENETETNETAILEITPEEGGEIQPRLFSVYVPIGQYRYIRVETEDGLTGEAIVKGRAGDEERVITLQPRKLPGKDEKPVEDKRKKFYGAYGRLWAALPVAFFAFGVYRNYNNSYNAAVYSTGNHSLYNSTRTSLYISIGAWSVAGAFLVETLVRMGIYVRTATKESVPLVK